MEMKLKCKEREQAGLSGTYRFIIYTLKGKVSSIEENFRSFKITSWAENLDQTSNLPQEPSMQSFTRHL